VSKQRDKGRSRRPGPRKPPPDATGEEETFIQELIDDAADVVIELCNGNTLQGTIVKSDTELLWLDSSDGLEITLRKNEIRHLHPAEGS
jgi:hypothetical protein